MRELCFFCSWVNVARQIAKHPARPQKREINCISADESAITTLLLQTMLVCSVANAGEHKENDLLTLAPSLI